MPGVVPKRSSPPNTRNKSSTGASASGSTSTASPTSFSEIKKRQAVAVVSAYLQSQSASPEPMSRHSPPFANGVGVASSSDVNSKQPRHRRKHRRSSSSSSSTAASTTSSNSEGSSQSSGLSTPFTEKDGFNGGSTGRTSPLPAFPSRAELDEWTGMMKKIVDEWEIPRKVLHSSIGFGVVYLYSQRPENANPVIYALSGSLAFIIPCDILRLNNDRFERLYEKVVGFLMRKSERESVNGVIWYMIGVIYVLALLPRDLAVMSILILSWCDTAASTFGRLYGRYTPSLPRRIPLLNLPLAPKKSVAGSLAACLTGAITAAVFWGYAVPSWQGYGQSEAERWGAVSWKWSDADGVGIINGGAISLALVSLLVGVISGVTEALDLGNIDDNLSLPIISGTVLWGLSKLAAWFLDFKL